MNKDLSIYSCENCSYNCHIVVNGNDFKSNFCLNTNNNRFSNFHKLENVSFMICDNRDLKNTENNNDANIITADEAKTRTEHGIKNILSNIFVGIRDEADKGNNSLKSSYLANLPELTRVSIIKKLNTLGYDVDYYEAKEGDQDFYMISW